MYKSSGKPSVAKFRSRMHRIHECAESGLELAENWNPKGRYFKIQRDMVEFFKWNEEASRLFLEYLDRQRTKAPPKKHRQLIATKETAGVLHIVK